MNPAAKSIKEVLSETLKEKVTSIHAPYFDKKENVFAKLAIDSGYVSSVGMY